MSSRTWSTYSCASAAGFAHRTWGTVFSCLSPGFCLANSAILPRQAVSLSSSALHFSSAVLVVHFLDDHGANLSLSDWINLFLSPSSIPVHCLARSFWRPSFDSSVVGTFSFLLPRWSVSWSVFCLPKRLHEVSCVTGSSLNGSIHCVTVGVSGCPDACAC